jgi:hypothetical protein
MVAESKIPASKNGRAAWAHHLRVVTKIRPGDLDKNSSNHRKGSQAKPATLMELIPGFTPGRRQPGRRGGGSSHGQNQWRKKQHTNADGVSQGRPVVMLLVPDQDYEVPHVATKHTNLPSWDSRRASQPKRTERKADRMHKGH